MYVEKKKVLFILSVDVLDDLDCVVLAWFTINNCSKHVQSWESENVTKFLLYECLGLKIR